MHPFWYSDRLDTCPSGCLSVRMDIPSPDARVAGNVRHLMDEHDTPDLKLATETGIPRTTLTRRLTGRSNFLLTELVAIAQFYGLSVVDLIGEDAA